MSKDRFSDVDGKTIEPSRVGSGSNPVQEAYAEIGRITTDEDITLNVPSDFDTLHEAIVVAGSYLQPKDRVEITVNIESGHEITEPVDLREGYYKKVRVVSEDNIVNVSNDFDDRMVIGVQRDCHGPIIETKIDAQYNAEIGLRCQFQSVASFGMGGRDDGIINTTDRNVDVANRSSLLAYNCDFSGSEDVGVRVRSASAATLGRETGVDVSNCGGSGLSVSGGIIRAYDFVADDCYRSVSSREGGMLIGSSQGGDGPSMQNIDDRAVYASGGYVFLEDATITDAGSTAIETSNGGEVYGSATIENADGNGLNARDGVISIEGEVVDSTFSDLSPDLGGTIRADGIATTNSDGSDPHIDDMGESPNTVTGSGIIFAEEYEE